MKAKFSQWFNACVSGTANSSYPYGNSYSRTACDGDGVVGTTVPVASMPTCQSPQPGYDGMYDLSGNVWEWEDSCDGPGESGNCLLRGSDCSGSSVTLQCVTVSSTTRSRGISAVTDFRCCSD